MFVFQFWPGNIQRVRSRFDGSVSCGVCPHVVSRIQQAQIDLYWNWLFRAALQRQLQMDWIQRHSHSGFDDAENRRSAAGLRQQERRQEDKEAPHPPRACTTHDFPQQLSAAKRLKGERTWSRNLRRKSSIRISVLN